MYKYLMLLLVFAFISCKSSQQLLSPHLNKYNLELRNHFNSMNNLMLSNPLTVKSKFDNNYMNYTISDASFTILSSKKVNLILFKKYPEKDNFVMEDVFVMVLDDTIIYRYKWENADTMMIDYTTRSGKDNCMYLVNGKGFENFNMFMKFGIKEEVRIGISLMENVLNLPPKNGYICR